jgi:predicted membrane channel-forming protein YqfA (hemolysin III family)
MFDIATTRTMATRFHQPGLIFALLVALSLVCAFLAGYGMAERSERSWMHLMGFAFSIALCVYVVYDLEYPRAGLIQLEGIDQVMVDLRASMQ